MPLRGNSPSGGRAKRGRRGHAFLPPQSLRDSSPIPCGTGEPWPWCRTQASPSADCAEGEVARVSGSEGVGSRHRRDEPCPANPNRVGAALAAAHLATGGEGRGRPQGSPLRDGRTNLPSCIPRLRFAYPRACAGELLRIPSNFSACFFHRAML